MLIARRSLRTAFGQTDREQIEEGVAMKLEFPGAAKPDKGGFQFRMFCSRDLRLNVEANYERNVVLSKM